MFVERNSDRRGVPPPDFLGRFLGRQPHPLTHVGDAVRPRGDDADVKRRRRRQQVARPPTDQDDLPLRDQAAGTARASATTPGSGLRIRAPQQRSSRSSAHSRAAAGSSGNACSSLCEEFEKFLVHDLPAELVADALAIDPPRAPDFRLTAMVSPLGQRRPRPAGSPR